ncbi:retropepsin-like aspartic protease family protein [Paraurantiacibacter namhicola]|uniref:Retroviral aspartyl protease n=1 Tax=Paraurantiacibacter namhicola TaxID=645517 RepID=A0A1C7DBD6_9SPHN|nr:TIGR02281 family clan AA aspartic protease [Paraurantiacibacter namhicola]ANU08809.1 Retroviral aspartyl protease [Paraurantiacibacter namhicola]
MRNAIILVAAVGGLAMWMAPNLPAVGEDPATGPEVTSVGGDPSFSALDTSNQAGGGWAQGDLVLNREADGHFYADISMKMRPYRMLVDTGASLVALTGQDAREMGLHWDPSQVSVIGHGASGEVHGVVARIPEMKLGEFTAYDVPAVIIPEGLRVSLLGQSFLQQIGSIRVEGDEMILNR